MGSLRGWPLQGPFGSKNSRVMSKMVTATSDVLKGIALWALAMVAPVLMVSISNSTFRLIFLTLVFPMVLSFLCRAGHFWVTHANVMIASVITFLLALVIQLNSNAKSAVENPDQNKTVAGLVYGSLVLTFLISMFIASKWVDMYSASEFNSENALSKWGY